MTGAAGVGTVLLAGCEPGEASTQTSTAPAGSGPSGSAGASPSGPEQTQGSQGGSDESLARELYATLAAQLALLRATTQRHPRLRGQLHPWVVLHRAHQQALAEAVPDDDHTDGAMEATPRARVPARAKTALQQARSASVELQQRFTDAAVQADSGAFARLLAAMAAGTAQLAAEEGVGE